MKDVYQVISETCTLVSSHYYKTTHRTPLQTRTVTVV